MEKIRPERENKERFYKYQRTVTTYTKLINKDSVDEETKKEFTNVIKENLYRMNWIVHDHGKANTRIENSYEKTKQSLKENLDKKTLEYILNF